MTNFGPWPSDSAISFGGLPIVSNEPDTITVVTSPPIDQYGQALQFGKIEFNNNSPEPSGFGRKFDGGKLEYGLLPPLALEETVKVLTFGAQKYERDNWKKVPDSKRRYFDAMERHIWAYKRGEQMDPESGIHHLAHAMCCLMFLYEHDIMYSLNDGEVK
jgi:hypothetical protein